MIVVVSGSRDYADGPVLRAVLAGFLTEFPDMQIYHGGASGADKLADLWAKDAGVPVRHFPADWSIGKSAGPIRNELMVKTALVESGFTQEAVVLLAFKNGLDRTLNSGGTEHACLVASNLGIKVITVDRIIGDYSNHPRIAGYANNGSGQGELFGS